MELVPVEDGTPPVTTAFMVVGIPDTAVWICPTQSFSPFANILIKFGAHVSESDAAPSSVGEWNPK
jgi:hypothetical protein